MVESRNACSVQPLSNEVGITPVAALPAPVNVVVHPGNTQATITFDPVDGALNYYFQIETSEGAIVKSGTLNDLYTTATGLTNGATYYFRVKSSSYAPSAYTADVAVTPSATLPLAPGSLTGEAGNREVSLRWGEVVGATGYRVFRRTAVPVANATSTLFTDNGLTNGMTYYYVAAAGAVTHAIRFTASRTQRAYVWPARHYASSITDQSCPPMGQRFRLKAGYDISGFSPMVQVILRVFKTYGLFWQTTARTGTSPAPRTSAGTTPCCVS
jgi:hypothetical protein